LEIEQQQRQTILNLYNSGITSDIIALQLDDVSKEEVDNIIENASIEQEERRKKISLKQVSDTPSLGSFYLDAVVNIDLAIKQAQIRMWKGLKIETEFNISLDETQDILERYNKSKVNVVILHIDLLDSTRLSMTLPADRFVTLIKTFTQEMSLMIRAYGGYILKYVGNAIVAFFITNSGDLYLPCINAVNCAYAMIRVTQEGINPILNQHDYPEIRVRVGIDVGENVVVQYGWDIYELDNKQTVKKQHLDILGYTISIAAKMKALARPDQIIVGQLVYDMLDDKQKSTFNILLISTDIWNYISSNTGDIYRLYGSMTKDDIIYR
jgi:class 3 adenylate cyclase